MIFLIFKWSSQTPFGEPQSVILQKMETLVWEEQYDHCIFFKNSGFIFRILIIFFILRLVSNTAYQIVQKSDEDV